MTLPGALNIRMADMFGKKWRDELSQDRKRRIVIADGEPTEKKAVALAMTLGYSNLLYLSGGLNEFQRTIINVSAPSGNLTPAQEDTYRFRSQASIQISELIKEQLTGPKKPPKLVKRIVGGCGA